MNSFINKLNLLEASEFIDFVLSGVVEGVECIKNGKFYRNPNFESGVRDCARYFWCPADKVLSFRCSAGLWFDVDRQICDFKRAVDNCEKAYDASTPKPLFATEEPICPANQLACASKKCIDRQLFCDVSYLSPPGRC